MKIFCMQCGNPHEYTSLKPKFCAECGEPLSSSIARREQKTPVRPLKPSRAQIQTSDDDEELDDTITDENIQINLEEVNPENEVFGFDITENPKRKKATIGDIVDPSSGPPVPITSKVKGKIDKKFFNEFMSDAKALRPKK